MAVGSAGQLGMQGSQVRRAVGYAGQWDAQGSWVRRAVGHTVSPSGVWISLCWRAGAPLEMKPTRLRLTPSSICFLITCAAQ